MAGCRAKQAETWESGTLVTHVWGTFNLECMVQSDFGVICALVLKWPVALKWLVEEQNGVK